jgi:5-methylthioadenosine/S-adenosylhomocysteine deaminase
MDKHGTVLPDGVIYIRDGSITTVAPAGGTAPAGFEHVAPLATGGTVYPGLLELHNHLSYNILRLWQVPRKYKNRGQWSDPQANPDYRKLISGPMQVLGKSPDIVPALVRYVEAKCLVAGVTTSQGIRLSSDPGIEKFYKGVLRNTDQPDDPALKPAPGRIADVAATGATSFAAELAKDNRLLLHLAEGVDTTARHYFTDLQLPDGSWAISNHLIGIHSVALQPDDISIMKTHGAGMVWSPLSNLLLYGQTAQIAEFHRQAVPIGLGSDWSPSGSKNLLCELKVAYTVAKHDPAGQLFTTADMVRMATSGAAALLDWQDTLGSLEPGKRADLVAITGTTSHYNQALIDATERDVILTMIGGVAVYGRPDLITPTAPNAEAVTVGGQQRCFNFHTPTADPTVAAVTLAQATQTLTDALQHLPELAATPGLAAAAPGRARDAAPGMTLALDEIEHTGFALRLNPSDGFSALPSNAALAAPLETILVPLELDPLTLIDDDAAFFTTLNAEPNLPSYLAPALASAYGHP